jgi:hypothetical protein
MLFGQIRLLLLFFTDVEGIESRERLIRLLLRVVYVRDGKATLNLCSGVALRTRRKDLATARHLRQSKRRNKL